MTKAKKILIKAYDYEILNLGDKYLFVVRDKYSTGIFTCDMNGTIILPGKKLLRTYHTYEDNLMAYNNIIEETQNDPEYFNNIYEKYPDVDIDNTESFDLVLDVIQDYIIRDSLIAEEFRRDREGI